VDPIETTRNETKRNETKRNETKRNETVDLRVVTRTRGRVTRENMSAIECVGRKSAVEEEDAGELRLGFDFKDANCLTAAEVKLVCQSKIDDDAEQGEEAPTTRTRVFEKTLAYVKRFSGRTSSTAAAHIRDLLQTSGLHDFEAAVISNLAPVDWDEAKTLVPSLESEERGLTEEGITAMLEEMANVRKFE
jgi:DNA-directed RNA polymerase II subunit RPB4